MADWIKMRSSLPTNPKVLRMARVLLTDPEFMEWFRPGAAPVATCDGVTKRDVEVVTRVTVGGLLSTWSAVTDTAGRDGVMRHASSHEVDMAAGIPGFTRALEAVEWVRRLPDEEGLQFVNFEEYNTPQKERSLTGKSGAERTAEWRKRKKAGEPRDETRDGKSDSDVTSQRDDREEREEGEDKKNPSGSTPPGKPARKTKAAKRVPGDFVVSDEMSQWAAEKTPLVDWQRETEKFRDWEFQHARTDWPATWRTWMRKAQETAEAKGGGSGVPQRQEAFV